jgi:ABC-type phosphate transport system substrate-binding protein
MIAAPGRARTARRAIAALLVVAAVAPTTASAQARDDARTITFSGSTSALPIVADLAYFYGRAVRSAPRFAIVGGGTAAGMADAARGIVSAGMVSRDVTDADPPGLVLTPIALSGVCLVTNRANALPGVTRPQVQELVSGRIQTWAQVPGSPRDDAVVPAALARTTGASSVFESVFIDAATQLSYVPRTFLTAAQVRDFVAATPGAWGYVDVAHTEGLHVLRFDGITCDRATIRSGSYPGRRPLGVVTRGRPRGPVARFLRWVATSRKARQVIATRYLVPRRQD